MKPDEQARLQAHTAEIAKILYKNTPPEALQSLATIEGHLRKQSIEIVEPQVAFFIKETTGTDKGCPRTVKSCVGELKIAEK